MMFKYCLNDRFRDRRILAAKGWIDYLACSSSGIRSTQVFIGTGYRQRGGSSGVGSADDLNSPIK